MTLNNDGDNNEHNMITEQHKTTHQQRTNPTNYPQLYHFNNYKGNVQTTGNSEYPETPAQNPEQASMPVGYSTKPVLSHNRVG
jgi:hypothetical protein